ncbi:MAG: hypothetical protein V3U31_01770, partial [Dehalococcoidia bacterium]
MKQDRKHRPLRAFVAGAAASLGAGLLSLALGTLLGGPSPAQLIQERVTLLLPLSITSGTIGFLQQAAKPLVLALIAAGWVAGGGAVSVIAVRLHRPGRAYPVLLGLGLWLAAVVLLLPALGQGLFGASAPAGAMMSSLFWLLISASYLLALEAAAAWAPSLIAGPQAPPDR